MLMVILTQWVRVNRKRRWEWTAPQTAVWWLTGHYEISDVKVDAYLCRERHRGSLLLREPPFFGQRNEVGHVDFLGTDKGARL